MLTLLTLLLAVQEPVHPAPLLPGTVTIEAPQGETTPEARQLFAEAAAAALADAGFTPLPGAGGARYTARLTLTRTVKGAVATRGATERAAASAGNWGAGLFVPLGRGGPRVRELMTTELAITLIARGADAPAWRGRGLTTSTEGTRTDDPRAIAAKLSAAIMRGFPHARDEAVSVP